MRKAIFFIVVLGWIQLLFTTSCKNESKKENELKPILTALSQDTSIII